MKWICTFVVLLVSLFPAYAQDSEIREVGPFSGVKVQEGIDVYLKKGGRELVRVEVEGTELSNILTEISGAYLKIHRKGNLFGNIDARVYVTYVDLDKLSASSAGSINSQEPIRAHGLSINTSSAGSVKITVEAKNVEVSCSSAGDVELKGKVDDLRMEVSSAGKIDAFDLEAGTVDAQASSGGSARFNVSQVLRAHASSGGSIRYRGSPQRSDTNSSSGGSVRKL